MNVKYFTIGQMARKLSISNSSIRRAIESGRLRGGWRTPGGHWRFSEAEVEDFRTRVLRANG